MKLLDVVNELIAIGLQPVACRDKAPWYSGWNAPEYRWSEHPFEEGNGVGIRLGVTGLVAIDIDYINEDLAWNVVEQILAKYPTAPVKLAPKGRGATVIVRTAAPYRTRKGPKAPEGRIELLGITGKGTATQTCIWGAHPNGGHYEQIPTIPEWDIPIVPTSFLDTLVPKEKTTIPKVKAFRVQVPTKDIVKVLDKLSPDDYDFWLQIGMALHNHFKGSDVGFGLWHDWSKRGETYTSEEDCRYKWDTFDSDGGITIKWLLAHDTTHGDELCESFFGYPREPYTEAEWDALATTLGLATGRQLTRNILVNCGGNDYYILSPNGWIGPDNGDGVLIRMKQVASAAPWVNVTTEEGKKLPLSALKESYCTSVVNEVKYSTFEKHSRLDHTTLVVAAPESRELKPKYDKGVSEWLQGLCSQEHLGYLLDWLATCFRFDEPAPMLYLQGAASRGKGFLAQALADYFYGPPTSGHVLFSQYNEDVRKNPFVFIDEELPADFRGKEQLDRLKEIITRRDLELTQKYARNTKLDGALRIIFASNPNKFLSRKANTYEQDVKALADRLVHVHVVDGPELPEEVAKRWFKEKTVLRHVSHLAQTREVKPGRLVCPSNGVHIAEAVAITSPWVNKTLDWITRTILGLKNSHGAILVQDDVVYVNGRLLVKSAEKAWGQRDTPDERALATAVFPRICHEESVRLQTPDGKRVRYRQLKNEAIDAWMQLMDRDEQEWKEALRKYEIGAFRDSRTRGQA